MKINQHTANQIRDIACFCIQHKGRCWKGWSANKIFRYLAFHFLAGTLFVARANNTIAGVGVAWLGSASEFIRRDVQREPQFDWRLPKKGDALMVAEVFGVRSSCKRLWSEAWGRYGAHVSKIFTYRQKQNEELPRLVELQVAQLSRMWRNT